MSRLPADSQPSTADSGGGAGSFRITAVRSTTVGGRGDDVDSPDPWDVEKVNLLLTLLFVFHCIICGSLIRQVD